MAQETETLVRPAVGGLHGEVEIPGDKSISHRSVMLSSLADTSVRIHHFLPGQDCLSTAACFRAMGAEITFHNAEKTELTVKGNGLHGLTEPRDILDAGNSGTTLRLMLGLMSAQPFCAGFTGDASLRERPMGRVVKPLSRMGARIYGRAGNAKLPLMTVPADGGLHGMTYESPVASAQVKSSILLAGMYASGATTVVEPVTSRDHTERMLEAFGVHTEKEGTAVTIHPVDHFTAPADIDVPGDISSAAYWLAAGSIVPGSDILLRHVGINPTRTGMLDVLQAMGADLTISNRRTSGGEEAADIRVRAAKLHGTEFGADIMPRLIDEIPAIAAAALFADGDTVITGAGELRVKETDRLQAIEDQWNAIAPGSVEGSADGLVIHGGVPVQAGRVESYDDHRMAMSLAIVGLAGKGVSIVNGGCVRISYPDFYDTLDMLQN